MSGTRPRLHNFRDNIKRVYHGPARYKMEWIYTRAKVSGQDGLELALEIRKKKERSIDKMLFIYTTGSVIPDCFHGA